MKKTALLLSALLVALLIHGCSAVPVQSRYGDVRQEDTTSSPAVTEVKKDTSSNKPFSFDFSPYRTLPEIKHVPSENLVRSPEYWYSLSDDSSRGVREPVKAPGYRILIHTTDEYPEADSIRTAVYLRTNKKAVYLDFESPFYKVKVGDYQFQRQAEELNFQLSQIGFRNTLVITDSVYVYK